MDYPSIDAKGTGAKLRRFCLLRGITVRQIQQYLGLSCPQSVYRWLKGISLPSVDNLYALSELLQVGMDELLAGNREFDRTRLTRTERVLQYMVDVHQEYVCPDPGEKCVG